VVKGQPGLNVSYRFVGSGFATGALQTGVIGNDGTLNVAEDVAVNTANQGTFKRRLLVRTRQWSKSNTATFSVTCIAGQPAASPLTGAAASPGPASARFGHVITATTSEHPAVGPSAPTHPRFATTAGESPRVASSKLMPWPDNLKNTTDPHVCGAHGGLAGVFCIQAVPDRYLVLIWDWTPDSRYPSIDGYHVYEVDDRGFTKVADQTNAQATIEFFKPESYEGKCYAVTAYKGAAESIPSNAFCTANAKIGAKTLVLGPARSGTNLDEYRNEGREARPYDLHCPSGEVCVGHAYEQSPTPALDDFFHINKVWRGYMTFDQNQVAGINIHKASLSLFITQPGSEQLDVSPKGWEYKYTQPCLEEPRIFSVGATTGQWEDTNDRKDGDFSYGLEVGNGHNTVDVTQIVRSWANGAIPNYGFVYKGFTEDTGADVAQDFCLVEIYRATLYIEYY
jgi:hypothetical protein